MSSYFHETFSGTYVFADCKGCPDKFAVCKGKPSLSGQVDGIDTSPNNP